MKNDEIQEIIDAYDKLVLGIDKRASNTKGRAYGGIVRSGKGKLLESIAKILIELAWKKLNGAPNRLKITRTPIQIPIKKDYVEKLEDEEIRNYIKRNIKNYFYKYQPDVLVIIDENPVLEIECKTYTENAMMKRILVDSSLVKTKFPDISFTLIQLESQLGGDYSELKNKSFGSPSTHTLLSYFNIHLHIITLLIGERKVDKPIHKKQFFKELERENLENAIECLSHILEKYK